MKVNGRGTIEVVAVLCVCGRAVLTAVVSEVHLDDHPTRVEGDVVPCSVCGSSDLAAARMAAQAQKLADKKPFDT